MPDLFDFFKENESKLRERPPEKVWTNLEKRLEKRKRRQRRDIRFLQTGSIALLILLLLFVAVVVYLKVTHGAKGF
jgi:cell division septal protein FtsQ